MKKSLVLCFSIFTLCFAQEKRELGNLIMENVPEISAEIEERSRQYRNTRSASFRSWNPNGKGMIIGTRFAETTQLHTVTEPLGSRNQITFFNEPVRGGIYCPDPTRNGFLFTKDTGGNEYYQIYYFDLNSGSSTLLTDGQSRNSIGPWSSDGKRFTFTSNMGNGVDMNIFVGDLSGIHTPLVEEPGYWGAMDWSKKDEKVLVIKYVSINESYIHIVDTESGELEPFNSKEKKISYGGSLFSKDGKGIYYTSDEDTDFRHLRYYDIKSGAHTILTGNIPWDVSGLDLSEDGRYLALTTNEDAVSRLRIFRTDRFKEVPIPDLPVGLMGGLEFHPNGKKLALTLNTPKTPGDVYVLDIRKKLLTKWTESEVGGLNTENFVEPQLIHVDSFDGFTIPGFIYKPEGKGPFPVIIYIHGGPESQFRPGFISTFQYWINELGAAVLATNVRGSAGYGKSYVQLDNGFKRENSVMDIGSFLDWIETQPDLDNDRIAVYGGSYGGYMVLASMTHFNDRLKCAVDVVGISNFVTFLKNTKEYRRNLRRAEYGDERDPEMNAFLEKISPNNSAQKITKPLFIVQGYNDPRVPVTEAEQMRDVIRNNGGDVWYMVAMDEGHGFRKKFNRDYYTNAVSLFWEMNLFD